MRRLTERLAEFAGTLDGIAFINPHDRQGVYNLKEIVDWSEDFYLYKIANRLAAYEDTGLTPKELAQIAIQTQRYEESGQKCNRGHVNSLPLRLWTCPVCAEELAADRDLYKRALYVGEDRVNAAALQQDPGAARERDLALAIAETAGIPGDEVLVDIPRLPGALSMEVRVRNSHTMVDIEQVSPLINTLNDTRRQQWRLGIYTTPEHRHAVEQAAMEVLRVKRATKQDKLVVA